MTIPAMTSDAEREIFRRLAREQAAKGAIVELGAWLGAGTVAIAAGIRDAGVRNVVHSYDRFRWNPRQHPAKAGFNVRDLFAAYRENLAEFAPYVTPHKVEIEAAGWDSGPIALLVCDGPKRLKPVRHVLATFGPWLRTGSVTAWQDFCFPPAYAIAACLYMLRDRLEYREAVDYTVVLKVRRSWAEHEVPRDLAWPVGEVSNALNYWQQCLPPSCYAGVACGAAMMLSDMGQVQMGRLLLSQTDLAPMHRLRKTHALRSYSELLRGI